MIAIIFKAILSSGLFQLAYKLLLEKEKMHQFNRFYLLFSLVLSFVIPFLTLKILAPIPIPIHDVLINAERIDPQVYSSQLVSTTETVNWSFILWTFYGIVTSVLLIRFVMNLKTIFEKIRLAVIIPYRNSKFVLTNEKIVPYSFLNYIFVNTENFKNGNIEEEILLHEITHAKQKHTIDILLIELAQVAIWFNPFLILYRKAIQLNHEFLADEEVIHSSHDVPAYQHLLVSKSRGQTSSVFMSSFNYIITKKRLIMMTKTTSNSIALAKQGAAVLLFACAILSLSSKTYAQTKADPITQPNSSGKTQLKQDQIAGKDNKASYLFEQVDSNKWSVRKAPIISKSLDKDSPTTSQLQLWSNPKVYGIWIDGNRMSNDGLNKYQADDFVWYEESLIKKNGKNYPQYNYDVNLMTPEYYEQFLKQKTQKPYEIKHVPDANLPKVPIIEWKSPTAYQLQNWMESEKYGVWLDGKRIINAELLKYGPTDFALFFESKLAKNAKNYGKHYYQVNLMTPKYYVEVFLQEMEKFRI